MPCFLCCFCCCLRQTLQKHRKSKPLLPCQSILSYKIRCQVMAGQYLQTHNSMLYVCILLFFFILSVCTSHSSFPTFHSQPPIPLSFFHISSLRLSIFPFNMLLLLLSLYDSTQFPSVFVMSTVFQCDFKLRRLNYIRHFTPIWPQGRVKSFFCQKEENWPNTVNILPITLKGTQLSKQTPFCAVVAKWQHGAQHAQTIYNRQSKKVKRHEIVKSAFFLQAGWI